MEEVETEIKKSKYNSGLFQISRIHNLWLLCHQASINGNFYRWNIILDRVWCELARDLFERSEDEYNKKSEEFNKFDEQIGIIKDKNESFSEPSKEEIKKRNDQYKILIKKEVFLRKLENELGKGTSWAEGTEHYMD